MNDKISSISINDLISKDIKALILDVDGTLISGNKPVLSKDIKSWVQNSKKYFYTYLFSNNPSRNRIKIIAEELNLFSAVNKHPGFKNFGISAIKEHLLNQTRGD